MADPSLHTREETPKLHASSHPTPPLPGSAAPPLSPNGPRYRLEEEIARGGMGIIFRAVDDALGREVAVKVLPEHFALDSGTARRFADEARIAAQLQHPAIPPVHDVGTLPAGRPFMAMKLIKGSTLDLLLEGRPDPAHERGRYVAVFEQVCQALAYAHAHQVIHRDLKPANVMVGAFGEVQVMDWGLAKVLASRERERSEDDPLATRAGTEVVSLRDAGGSFTQAGSVLGTPAFMPPEQAVGAVGKVDARSDVFGLGAILAVILTGQPPFAATSAETTRVKAAQGKVQECFGRLDGCGADPELVALCKRCLAPDKDERPADAGEVAKAVAQLRAAADERARRAELERVRLAGEQAAAEARAAERRKRRRLAFGAAAALAVALIGGLLAVLRVQQRANAGLADKQAKVEARFETALQAIATFHTGVSEDVLLKNDQLKGLRTKLLTAAAGFYSELEKLLEGQSDPKSRTLLAESYAQLGELTEKIGDQKEALRVQRQALALRRELAEAPGADVETRLNVARSLRAVGLLLRATGDAAGALAAFEEQRDLATALEAGSRTDAVRAVLANSHNDMGNLLRETGKPGEALKEYEQALAIRQQLAAANPAVTQLQSDLAWSHNNVGIVLAQTGKPGEALTEYEQALAIRRQLADANPAVTLFQRDLSVGYYNLGVLLGKTGKPEEALKAYERARAIQQELAAANPTVTQLQSDLARSHNNIGVVLWEAGKPGEALKEYEQALAIQQKLADANPAVTLFRRDLGYSHHNIGDLLARQGSWTEAITAYREALTVRQKLAEANPPVTDYQRDLASTLSQLGIAQRRGGRPADAVASFRKAIVIMEGLPTLTPGQRYELACYRARLAEVAAASGSGVTAAEGQAAADQALAALRQAVAAGYRNVAHMKIDTDLDALRPRPDFQQLLKELEAKSP